MELRWLRCELAPIALMTTLVLGIGIVGTRAQGADAALDQQMHQLYGAGRYAEATEIATHYLALAERQFGRDHPEVGGCAQ